MDSQHGRPLHEQLAPRAARFTAFVFDVLGAGLLGTLLGKLTSNDSFLTKSAFALFVLAQAPWIASRGQTLGKRIVGLRIVREDTGLAPGWHRGVVLRTLIPQALFALLASLEGPLKFPWIGGIAFALDSAFVFGAQRLCLHDWLAGTRVLKLGPPR